MSFFNKYPEFFETSKTGAFPNKLNQRSKILIEDNLDIIKGKNILDIASHDGRFSFSAIKHGAKHVLGIEGRDEHVKNAINTMKKYQIPEEKYQFIAGDIHKEIIKILPGTVDTVFCFGFFYHTIKHYQLLSEIKRLKANYLILDTSVVESDQPIIFVKSENAKKEGKAIRDNLNVDDQMVIGFPSKKAIEIMLTSLGFDFIYLNWDNSGITNWEHLSMYSSKHVPIKKKISHMITRLKNPKNIPATKRVSIRAQRKRSD